jgi:multidrug efflux pump subunit AcrB
MRTSVVVLSALALALSLAGPGCSRRAAPPPAAGPAPAAVATVVVAAVVVATVPAPAFGAAEVEALVAAPLEARLAALPGLARVESVSVEGAARLTAHFAPDVPPERAREQVREALAAATAELPDDVEPPLLHPPAGEDAAWFVLPAGAADPRRLGAAARALRSALLGVPGVATVELSGAPRRVLRVRVDPQRLAAVGLTASDVAAALAETALDSPAGRVGALAVRVTSAVHGAAELLDTVLRRPKGPPDGTPAGPAVRLGDVATVEDAVERGSGCLTAAGPAVCGRVVAQAGAAAAAVRERVAARLAEALATLPPGVSATLLPPGLLRHEVRWPAPEPADAVAGRVADALTGAAAAGADGRPWLLAWGGGASAGPADRAALVAALASAPLPTPGADPLLAALRTVPGVEALPSGPADLESPPLPLDRPELPRLAAEVEAGLRALPGTVAVQVDGAARRPQVVVRPDRARLAALGLRAADVSEAVALALGSRPAAELVADGERVPVYLETGAADPTGSKWERLQAVLLRLPDGSAAPLTAVAAIELRDEPAEIHRRLGRPCLTIRAWGPDGAVRDAWLSGARGVLQKAFGRPEAGDGPLEIGDPP